MHLILRIVALLILVGAAGCAEDGRAPSEDSRRTEEGSPDKAFSREDASRSEEESPVRFFREYVTVEPRPGRTHVSALYYFRNDSDRPVQQVIQYPFPVDRHHLYPSVVRVWEKTDSELKVMGFAHRSRSVLWRMGLEPGGEKVIRVDYTQDTKSPHAIYIVTTTKQWGRPIELAEFEFRIPAELTGVEFSFEPDRHEVQGDTLVYFMSRTEFLPDEDLVVTWDGP